ncbi:phosphatase PAP2 family protein [Mariniflexile jejuense]|uniref:Phosphatase PAP2 family protein n=1 Tax=Mariniflexile jejuense TaxID=1173582 RepID=A0ABW3JKE2_9FLAO
MNLKLKLLIPSFLLLLLIYLYFIIFNNGANYTYAYINIQKDLFFFLNNKLSQYPNLQFNLTQLGDVIIFFPFLSIFIIYAPKVWDALLISAIISLIVSATLKKLFAVPRPAAIFNNDSFSIIGKTLTGHTSLPSGHSIATFIVITIVLYAFMPKKHKKLWYIFMLLLGLIIAFSRVGVGAHYPLDVIIGSTIGYIVTIIGIKISNVVNLFSCIKNKKNYPIFMLVLAVWSFFIIKKIIDLNLPIFYISLLALVVTLYLITSTYVKKTN